MAHSRSLGQESSISFSQTIMGGVYGYLAARLGGLLFKEPSDVRDAVGFHPTFPHQHLGNDGGFPGFEVPSSSCGYPCVDPVRQLPSCELSESPRFSHISSSQRLDSLHFPSFQEERSLPHIARIQNVVACSVSIHCRPRGH